MMNDILALFGIHPSLCNIIINYLFRFTGPQINHEIQQHINHEKHSENIILYCIEYDLTIPVMEEFICVNYFDIIIKILDIFAEDTIGFLMNINKFHKPDITEKEAKYANSSIIINMIDKIILEACFRKNKLFLDYFIRIFNLGDIPRFCCRYWLSNKKNGDYNTRVIPTRDIFRILVFLDDMESLNFMWEYFILSDFEDYTIGPISNLLFGDDNLMKRPKLLNFIKTKVCNRKTGIWNGCFERIHELELMIERTKM